MLVGFDSVTFCVNNLCLDFKEEKTSVESAFPKNFPIRKNFFEKKKTLFKSTVKVWTF